MNGTTSSPPVGGFPLLPNVLRLADSLLPPLPRSNPVATIKLVPDEVHAPIYLIERDSLWSAMTDKYLALAAPVVVYWLLSLVYDVIDRMQWPLFEKYRIHEPEEIKARNRVSKTEVIKMVAFQQIVQTALGIFVLEPEEVSHAQTHADHRNGITIVGNYLVRLVGRIMGAEAGTSFLLQYGVQTASWLYWWGVPLIQFFWAFFVMDTWQYFLHRSVHESRWLYTHFHSHHHRLYVPYAFGALYNHPVEGLLLDSCGGALSYFLSVMTVRQSILLFAFSTMKTVDDHGGYAFPWWIDPLHLIFPNTAEYHDIHHQMQGLRYNYSQPFFIHFDVLLGTRMDKDKLEKMRAHNAKKTWKKDLEDAERAKGEKAQKAYDTDATKDVLSASTALPPAAEQLRQRTTTVTPAVAAAA